MTKNLIYMMSRAYSVKISFITFFSLFTNIFTNAPGGFSWAFDMLIYMMSRAYCEKISFVTFFPLFTNIFTNAPGLSYVEC